MVMPGNLDPPPSVQDEAFDDWLDDLYEFIKYPVFKGPLEMASDMAIYFGNADTNGSWRIVRSGTDIHFDRREAGAWVNKGSHAA
jgi:hypothetical protein